MAEQQSGLNLMTEDMVTRQNGLGAVPNTENMVAIKHDARTGALGIQVQNPDNSATGSERYLQFPIEKVGFVPTLWTVHASDSDERQDTRTSSQPSALNAGVYDLKVYSNKNNDVKDLGVTTSKNVYETFGAKNRYRVVGVLHNVNGLGLADFVKNLGKPFGSIDVNKAVGIYMDFTPKKLDIVRNRAGQMLGAGNLLTIEGGQFPELTQVARAKFWLPKVTLETLAPDRQATLEKYASEITTSYVEWLSLIRANDAFLTELLQSPLAGYPELVPTLSRANITDIDSLNERLSAFESNADRASAYMMLWQSIANTAPAQAPMAPQPQVNYGNQQAPAMPYQGNAPQGSFQPQAQAPAPNQGGFQQPQAPMPTPNQGGFQQQPQSPVSDFSGQSQAQQPQPTQPPLTQGNVGSGQQAPNPFAVSGDQTQDAVTPDTSSVPF